MNIYKIKTLNEFLKKLAFNGIPLSLILRSITIFLLFGSIFKESPEQNTFVYVFVLLSLLYSWFLVNKVIEDETKIAVNIVSVIIIVLLLIAIFDPNQIIQTFGSHTNLSMPFKMIMVIYLFITIFHFRDDKFYAEFLLNYHSNNKTENIKATFLSVLYGYKYFNYYDLEKKYRALNTLLSADNKSVVFYSKVMSDFFEIFCKAEARMLVNNHHLDLTVRDKVFSIRGFYFYPEQLNKHWQNFEFNEEFLNQYNEVISKLKTL